MSMHGRSRRPGTTTNAYYRVIVEYTFDEEALAHRYDGLEGEETETPTEPIRQEPEYRDERGFRDGLRSGTRSERDTESERNAHADAVGRNDWSEAMNPRVWMLGGAVLSIAILVGAYFIGVSPALDGAATGRPGRRAGRRAERRPSTRNSSA